MSSSVSPASKKIDRRAVLGDETAVGERAVEAIEGRFRRSDVVKVCIFGPVVLLARLTFSGVYISTTGR